MTCAFVVYLHIRSIFGIFVYVYSPPAYLWAGIIIAVVLPALGCTRYTANSRAMCPTRQILTFSSLGIGLSLHLPVLMLAWVSTWRAPKARPPAEKRGAVQRKVYRGLCTRVLSPSWIPCLLCFLRYWDGPHRVGANTHPWQAFSFPSTLGCPSQSRDKHASLASFFLSFNIGMALTEQGQTHIPGKLFPFLRHWDGPHRAGTKTHPWQKLSLTSSPWQALPGKLSLASSPWQAPLWRAPCATALRVGALLISFGGSQPMDNTLSILLSSARSSTQCKVGLTYGRERTRWIGRTKG